MFLIVHIVRLFNKSFIVYAIPIVTCASPCLGRRERLRNPACQLEHVLCLRVEGCRPEPVSFSLWTTLDCEDPDGQRWRHRPSDGVRPLSASVPGRVRFQIFRGDFHDAIAPCAAIWPGWSKRPVLMGSELEGGVGGLGSAPQREDSGVDFIASIPGTSRATHSKYMKRRPSGRCLGRSW